MEQILSVQLNPALMEFKGLTIPFRFRQNFVIAKKEKKKKDHKIASVIVGIPLLVGLLERDLTVWHCRNLSKNCGEGGQTFLTNECLKKGRIHGYPSCVRRGRGSDRDGH